MVKKPRLDRLNDADMKEQVDLKKILKAGKLTSELDLERALILDRKLRLLIKNDPTLFEARAKLRTIIKDYEEANWSIDADIDDLLLKESELAEHIAEQERVFLENRKLVIKEKMQISKISQQDLGKILGHGKSYMSELINGISPFGMRDLVILHRLFGIKLELLIPTIISEKDRVRIKVSLHALNKPHLKLEK